MPLSYDFPFSLGEVPRLSSVHALTNKKLLVTFSEGMMVDDVLLTANWTIPGIAIKSIERVLDNQYIVYLEDRLKAGIVYPINVGGMRTSDGLVVI